MISHNETWKHKQTVGTNKTSYTKNIYTVVAFRPMKSARSYFTIHTLPKHLDKQNLRQKWKEMFEKKGSVTTQHKTERKKNQLSWTTDVVEVEAEVEVE